jgi:hypothetical protein
MGRILFHNFNVENKNDLAVQIGLSQLKSFMSSAGSQSESLEDVRDLEGLSALAQVKIKTDPTYGDKNEISYFKPYKDSPKTKEKEQMGFDPGESLPF